MTERRLNVLFLCNDNAARSLYAESLLNRLGRTKFQAFSAGMQPRGEIYPSVVAELERNNFDPAGLRSKGVDEFLGPDAPRMDFVFTLSDSVGAGPVPELPGAPMTAHWGVRDPAAAEDGDELQRKAAHYRTFAELESRISILVNLPIQSLDRLKLQQHLDDIGRGSRAGSE